MLALAVSAASALATPSRPTGMTTAIRQMRGMYQRPPRRTEGIPWRYEERIKSLSQTERVSKFCMDA